MNVVKRKSIKWLGVVLCIGIGMTSVKALEGSSSNFKMAEIGTGIMIKTQGQIGNNEYFNGYGGGAKDDFKLMIDVSSGKNEFVYCIEPGVVSIDHSNYVGASLDTIFSNAYNAKTSWQSKKANVAKLLQLVKDEHRYDDKTVETRLHYFVIQTLIWEVMCEERAADFSYIGPPAYRSAITQLLTGADITFTNRFNELYDEYASLMNYFNVIPSFMDKNSNTTKTIELSAYDPVKKEYYTVLKDTQNVVKWFLLSGDKLKIEINGDSVRISCTVANYQTTLSGYNTKIRNNASNPEKEMVGHRCSNYQTLVSMAKTGTIQKTSYLKVKVPDYRGTLTIDPNGGVYNGSSKKTVIEKMKGDRITINPPTRTGYTFKSWQLLGVGQLKDNVYTFGSGKATLQAQWINETPEIEAPIVSNNEGPFIEGRDLIIQLGEKFIPLNHVSAYDKEDGNITSRIKVIENPVPCDNQSQTTQSGTYEVVYQVSDQAQATVTKRITVIVNDPPVIQAENRYFFVGDDIQPEIILNGADAYDKEDGDITNKIIIKKSTIQSQTEGSYEVVFSVTDRYRKETTKAITVYVMQTQERKSALSIRYIGLDYLNTLSSHSKWRTNPSLNQLLINTLKKPEEDQVCAFVFSWSGEQNEEIKNTLLTQEVDPFTLFEQFRKR